MIIRTLNAGDWEAVREILPAAFAGFPWYEDLSSEEVRRRIEIQRTKRGFSGLIAREGGMIVGASWWDSPTFKELGTERGVDLANFAAQKVSATGSHVTLIWGRETIVDPSYQGRGIASALKKAFVERLSREGGFLVLTRMREDNRPIIAVNKKLGFVPTGIRIKSSQIPSVFHEYWYLEIPAAW